MGRKTRRGRTAAISKRRASKDALRATEEEYKYIKQTACILKDGGVKAQKLKDFITSLNDT